jgi:hypothetical protein
MNELLLEDAVDDYPARVRIVVDEDDGDTQLGLMWGVRKRHYSAASTARLVYEAEALQPLDTAARAALSGASGGTVVTHGTLSTNWTPVLGTNLGGAAYLTHTGTYRWRCRYRTTSGTAVQLRSVYDVGDLVLPVENTAIRCNAGTQFFIADLGELRLDSAPVGTHRWAGMIQAKGAVGGENISIDEVWFQPLDEGGGVLRTPVNVDPGLANYAARDEFNQTAGPLTGKTAAVGGAWTGAGDADDFSVETTGHTARRTAVSDGGGGVHAGHLALSGASAMTRMVVRVDAKWSVASGTCFPGVIARYVDINSFLAVYLPSVDTAAGVNLVAETRIAGSYTTLGGLRIFPVAVGQQVTIAAFVDTNGLLMAWGSLDGVLREPQLLTQSSTLATGGVLASGKAGFVDTWQSATASTRNFDNFAAWVPVSDAVMYPS